MAANAMLEDLGRNWGWLALRGAVLIVLAFKLEGRAGRTAAA